MHPILISLGSFEVHTYGALIALGMMSGLFVTGQLSRRAGIDPSRVSSFCMWLILLGMFGARLLFCVVEWRHYFFHPLEFFEIWKGGLVFYGALLIDVPFAFIFLRKSNLPLWKTFDALTPALVIGHAFGRLGCLAAGCCHGKPTDFFWGVHLHSELVAPELRGVPLHPTQLYEFLGLALLFVFLLRAFKKKRFDGQVLLIYLLIYPILRSVIEIFRGDVVRGFVIEGILSTSQFISLGVFVIAAVILFVRLRAVRTTRLLDVAFDRHGH